MLCWQLKYCDGVVIDANQADVDIVLACGCSRLADLVGQIIVLIGLTNHRRKFKTFFTLSFFGCTDLRFPPKTITKLFHMCFLLCLSESKLNSPQFDVRQLLSARCDRLISEAD